MKRKTFAAKSKDIKRENQVIDAKGMVLGRLATHIADVLRGKHKVEFTRHVDCGDPVVVINAKDIKVTGTKEKTKMYFTHSGYPHGHKLLNMEALKMRDPRRVLLYAVKGMLPKGTLGAEILKKLTIHAGPAKEETCRKIQK